MATQAMTVYVSWAGQHYRGLRYDTGIACRKIEGSNAWSQHAHGNAVDVFGPGETLEALYLASLSRKGPLGIRTICYRGRGGCEDPHLDHVHVDFHPKQTGTPACAGGTGRNSVVDRLIPKLDVGDIPVVGGIIGGAGNVGATLGDVVATLGDPATYIRAALLLGGGALVLIGVVRLSGGSMGVRDLTPAGLAAKVAW